MAILLEAHGGGPVMAMLSLLGLSLAYPMLFVNLIFGASSTEDITCPT